MEAFNDTKIIYVYHALYGEEQVSLAVVWYIGLKLEIKLDQQKEVNFSKRLFNKLHLRKYYYQQIKATNQETYKLKHLNQIIYGHFINKSCKRNQNVFNMKTVLECR